MGCDIHAFVEVKRNGKWLLYNQPPGVQNYKLFEKMAGVRGDINEAMVPPRGMPEDASEVTALVYEKWIADAHNASWLSAAELRWLEVWFENRCNDAFAFNRGFGYLFENGFAQERDSWPHWVEDVRLVFFFDN